ncbi:MAG: T9SS type A sorting domain-containing protein [Flavobacteriales bacterium]|nr:T9SS type A sorting domain-containing protein [Flavobacteriales bacterium]
MRKVFIAIWLLFVCVGLNAQVIEFNDIKFKERLLKSGTYQPIAFDNIGRAIALDKNKNGEIEVSEAKLAYKLEVQSSLISDLHGIEFFTNITKLVCGGNKLTNLDLSKNLNLEELECANSKLITLNIQKLKKLSSLIVYNNQLSEINTHDNINLKSITCNNNELTSFDFSNNLKLSHVICNNNRLSQLDFSNNPMVSLVCDDNFITSINIPSEFLEGIYCKNNKINYLDLSKNKNLQFLHCSSNELSALDLSNNHRLWNIECQENKLKELDFSNNPDLRNWKVSNPNLEYLNLKNGANNCISGLATYLIGNVEKICVDESEYELVKSRVKDDVLINSYCSFNGIGKWHKISGNIINCKEEEQFVPKVDFKIDERLSLTEMIYDKSNSYEIFLKEGSYTIYPIIEDGSYYSIEPESFYVKLPSEDYLKEINQDFCITPIGDINDLEITIAPIGIPARPGFDTTYKIVYKNKGTSSLSGIVELNYKDDVLDFDSSSESPTENNDGKVLWKFTNLKPFESSSILVRFNVNSPMEDPAVNNGDLLNFTASISFDGTDETPNDNTHELRQTVVGSYDPNDKTCLEGTDVLPEMIGEYIHYRIRFENTGTFPAENIVVVDEIDESKFDVSTLVPLDASHDFETRITGNKVEFIFEGIQLPFEDATNDGYVIFKIKTLPTLKLGDSFSNQASIYFDFNFPIITNNETTTIVEEHLGVEDFDFTDELTVYPNPVADRLYITSKNNAQLQSLEIYNLQGQMVLSVPQVSKMSFEVSHLPKGTYLVKVKTDRGEATTKIVKE